MLVLTRKSRQSIMIGDNIIIKVMGIFGGHVDIGIDAPLDIEVHREEIYQKIQDQILLEGYTS